VVLKEKGGTNHVELLTLTYFASDSSLLILLATVAEGEGDERFFVFDCVLYLRFPRAQNQEKVFLRIPPFVSLLYPGRPVLITKTFKVPVPSADIMIQGFIFTRLFYPGEMSFNFCHFIRVPGKSSPCRLLPCLADPQVW